MYIVANFLDLKAYFLAYDKKTVAIITILSDIISVFDSCENSAMAIYIFLFFFVVVVA